MESAAPTCPIKDDSFSAYKREKDARLHSMHTKKKKKKKKICMVHITQLMSEEQASMPENSPPLKENWTGRQTTFAGYYHATKDIHCPSSARL